MQNTVYAIIITDLYYNCKPTFSTPIHCDFYFKHLLIISLVTGKKYTGFLKLSRNHIQEFSNKPVSAWYVIKRTVRSCISVLSLNLYPGKQEHLYFK